MRPRLNLCWAWFGLLIAAPAYAGQVHLYQLDLSPRDRLVTVRAEVAAGSLRARDGHVRDIKKLQSCDGVRLLPRSRDTRTLVLPDSTECLRYQIKLEPVQERWQQSLPSSMLLVSPSSFLWLPALGPDDEVRITLKIPDNYVLSVPWQQLAEDRWRIVGSPGSSRALMLLAPSGSVRELELPGLQKPAVFVPRHPQHTRYAGKIKTWLTRALSSSAAPYPNPHLQILAIDTPSRADASPVPFGHVIRDQGEAVRFFVDSQRDLAALDYDWTAVHELAHPLLPYVDRRWISEGFASYYQNVLQARRGEYSEQEMWRRLLRSFRRAGEVANMSPEQTETAEFWRARMMIYWAGAALALQQDVALRQHHGQTLDRVLSQLARCCLPSQQTWRSTELMERLDQLSQTQVFSQLYQRVAYGNGMPDLGPLLRDLGVVEVDTDAVEMRDDAPLAEIRRRLTGAAAAAP